MPLSRSSFSKSDISSLKQTIDNVKKSIDSVVFHQVSESPELRERSDMQTPSVQNSQNFDNPCEDESESEDDIVNQTMQDFHMPMTLDTPDMEKPKRSTMVKAFEPSPTSNAALSTKRDLQDTDFTLIERIKNERLTERRKSQDKNSYATVETKRRILLNMSFEAMTSTFREKE